MNRKINSSLVVNARFARHLSSDQAFTLTELMVVIAVLAVLGGLLLPALAATHDRNNRAVCQFNLRQIAVVATQYAGDNNDYVLPAYANVYPLEFDAQHLSPAALNEVGLITNGPSIWTCPNLPGFPSWNGLAWVVGYQYYGGITNWINNISSTGHASDSPVKLSQAKPYWMLAADVVAQLNGLGNGWGSIGDYRNLPAHHTADSMIPQGGNEVFSDGSVQWIDLEKMYFMHSEGSIYRAYFFYQDLSADAFWRPRIAAVGVRAQPTPNGAVP
jgi:prepilin-type N-terminal cleavage/methylation domain-containing protein